eukprot:gene9570-biopygen15208
MYKFSHWYSAQTTRKNTPFDIITSREPLLNVLVNTYRTVMKAGSHHHIDHLVIEPVGMQPLWTSHLSANVCQGVRDWNRAGIEATDPVPGT